MESLPEQNPRADIARAVVHAGWNLMELKSTIMTLEEAYLATDRFSRHSSSCDWLTEECSEKYLDHLPPRTLLLLCFTRSPGCC